VDWIHITQDKGQQRILVNMVMELRIPRKGKRFIEYLRNDCLFKKKSLCFT
jgi:hypothetical protein